MTRNLLIAALFSLTILSGCTSKAKRTERILRHFLNTKEKEFVSAYKKYALAEWKEYTAEKTDGKDLLKRAQELNRPFSNDESFSSEGLYQLPLRHLESTRQDFDFLKKIKESGLITDPQLCREALLMHNMFLDSQIGQERLDSLIAMEMSLKGAYNRKITYRDSAYSFNDFFSLYREPRTSDELREMWYARAAGCEHIANQSLTLIKKKNKIARELGYKDYFDMSLAQIEVEPQLLCDILDEMDSITRPIYLDMKQYLNKALSERLGCKPEELRVWHYQSEYAFKTTFSDFIDFNEYAKNIDIEDFTKKYYKSVGIELGELFERSRLADQKDNPHFFMIDIDNSGDVRLIGNLKPEFYTIKGIIHVAAHAAYEINISNELPYVMRLVNYNLSEGIAALFTNLIANRQWLEAYFDIRPEDQQKLTKQQDAYQRVQQLVKMRNLIMSIRFIKKMYEAPDSDLNGLYGEMLQEYMFIPVTEKWNKPYWAVDPQKATGSVHTTSFIISELIAAQLHRHYAHKLYPDQNPWQVAFTNNPQFGKLLISDIFVHGNSIPWNQLLEQVTGEKLTSRYYVDFYLN